jgi:hypothetical protein
MLPLRLSNNTKLLFRWCFRIGNSAKHAVFYLPVHYKMLAIVMRESLASVQKYHLMYRSDKFSSRMPCQMGLKWYVRWLARILIGQPCSGPSQLEWRSFERLKLSHLYSILAKLQGNRHCMRRASDSGYIWYNLGRNIKYQSLSFII